MKKILIIILFAIVKNLSFGQLINSVSNSLGAVAGAVQGQEIELQRTTDFGDWIYLDGRLKTTLTTPQQAVCAILAISNPTAWGGANIPDRRNRFAIGASVTYPLGTTGGGATIAQNMLPQVQLPLKTSVANNGLWYRSNPDAALRLSNPSGQIYDASTILFGQAYVDLNGNVAQQPFTPFYYANAKFVWLGPSVTTATSQFPLSAAGNANFNPATGVFTVPPLTFTTTGTGNPTFAGNNLDIPKTKIFLQSNSTLSKTLGGVMFTINASDPWTLTTSFAASGAIHTTVYQYVLGANFDYWATASSGASGLLARGKSWANVTVGTIGIVSPAYQSTGSGYLQANGNTYQINATSNANIGICFIELVSP